MTLICCLCSYIIVTIVIGKLFLGAYLFLYACLDLNYACYLKTNMAFEYSYIHYFMTLYKPYCQYGKSQIQLGWLKGDALFIVTNFVLQKNL